VLWTCLRLPDLGLQALTRADKVPRAIALATRSTRPDVFAASPAARRLGVEPGLSVATALAIAPTLEVRPRDEALETRALEGIAAWAGQFSASVALAPPHAVLLETGASAGYFRGFDNLVARIAEDVLALGWEAVIASAPTPSGALLLARAGFAAHETGPHAFAQRLARVPLALLRTAQDALATLRGLGLRDIGDLLRLPAGGVARRFGQPLLDEIRRALGELPDPVVPYAPPGNYVNRIELPAPVAGSEALVFAVNRLVLELAGHLRARGQGVMRLRLELVHEDVPPSGIVFGLAATRDAGHILDVLRERIARERLPGCVEAIVLESIETVSLDDAEGELFPGAQAPGETPVRLIERLRARLGDAAVGALRPHADRRPERAWREAAIDEPCAAAAEAPFPPDARPLWLLSEPRALPGHPHNLTLTAGPERIEGGWWDGGDVARDYFVGRNDRGERWWVFRDRAGRWFLHGVFA